MQRRALYNLRPRVFLLLVLILLVTYRVWPKHTSGFRVRIAPCNCSTDRTIVLRVAANGQLFVNFEPAGKDSLGRRLGEIYPSRDQCTLPVFGDPNASYQDVINAIEIVESTPQMKRVPPRLNIPIPQELKTSKFDMPVTDIQLVIPAVVSRPCDGHQYCEGPDVLVPRTR